MFIKLLADRMDGYGGVEIIVYWSIRAQQLPNSIGNFKKEFLHVQDGSLRAGTRASPRCHYESCSVSSAKCTSRERTDMASTQGNAYQCVPAGGSFFCDSSINLSKLEKVQNQCMRIIGSFIRTTPIHVNAEGTLPSSSTIS